MSASDELVDVIAEAAGPSRDCECTLDSDTCDPCMNVARAVLAALVERYGEPHFTERTEWRHHKPPQDQWQEVDVRRLVFPWQAVKEAASDV